MVIRKKFPNYSGVSETIGFIIIFGIVMTGIAIVTLYGYPALMEEQANANIKNMEKNMLVLQSDLKSLTFKNVPYQETAMQVSGGTLKIQNPTDPPNFTITIGGTPETYSTGALQYESSDGQASVTLENGAIHIRYWSSPTGSAMLAVPSWYYDSYTNTYVIQIVRIFPQDNSLAQTGIGTVRMQLVNSSQTDPRPVNNTDYIEYHPRIEYHYGVAWNNFMRSPDLGLSESSPGKFSFKNNSFLIIKKYNVTFLSL